MPHEELHHRINLPENRVLEGIATRRTTGSPRSAQDSTDNAAQGASQRDWTRRTDFGSAAVAEPPHSDPERTGPRHVGDFCSTASLRIKEDLLRIVKQMEFHREEIQAHHRQLSVLEQQHAELIAFLPGIRATDEILSDEQVQVMQNATGLQGASMADTVIEGQGKVNENLASLVGLSSVCDEATTQLEAAEARLGLQGFVQRARSASSGRSTLPMKARRPGSASSTLSGPPVVKVQGVASDETLCLRSFAQRTRSLVDIQELLGRSDFAEATAKTGEGGERPGSAVLPWKRLFKAHWEPR